MTQKSLKVIALLLTILIVGLFLIWIQIEEPRKNTSRTITVGDSVGSMETFEVGTEQKSNNYPASIRTSDRYDENLLEYFDKKQEARDNTFSGR